MFRASSAFVRAAARDTWPDPEPYGRFTRAYLDKEGDPMLAMDVDLDDGGMSAALFIDNIEFWTTQLGIFQKHIKPAS